MAPALIVDFHCHLTPPEWARGRPIPPVLTDVPGFLERKRAAGIDVAVLCNAMLNLPGATVDNLSVEQVKAWNEFARGLVAEAEGRVVASVGINPFGGDPMLEELRACVESGEFRGVTINATVGGRHLGDPALEEFWALVEELDVPILVHPSSAPPGCDVFSELSLQEYALRPSEVSLSIAAAILAGVLDRHPALTLVAGAGGVGLPMVLFRLDVPHTFGSPGPPGAHRATSEHPPSTYLSKLYVDSTSLNLPTLDFNVRTMGASNMLLGTDSPPLAVPPQVTLAMIDELDVGDAERDAIRGGTATRLLKLTI